MPDPWFDQPDSELVDITFTASSNQSLEGNLNENTDNLNSVNIEKANKPLEPESRDIPTSLGTATGTEPVQDGIKSLTDLFVDQHQEKQPPESATATPANTPANTADTIAGVSDRNLGNWIDDFIPASPKENLLPQEQSQGKAVPEISLNVEQLRQLEEDLANFDRDSKSTLQPEPNLVNTQPVELPKVADNSLESTATNLDLQPPEELISETEKKNQAKIETKENPLLSVFKPVHKTNISLNSAKGVWYIGIDIGTTGISAALLNRSTTEVYPIYWSAAEQPEPDAQSSSFRLPAEVYLPKTVVAPSKTTNISEPIHNLFSAHLKPYLQLALPFKDEGKKWEPVVEFNHYSTLPLVWVVRSLSKLLSTLKCDRSSTTPGLIAAAVGIQPDTFHQIIDNIAGVICNFPSSWSEQYRFNIREALLACKLVQHPQQVFFVEEAIATLLSELDSPEGEIVKFSVGAASRPAKTSERSLFGNTLTINIGAIFTQMALVDLPESLLDLTHSDFMLHDFAYAGKGIDQDIICQLLLPSKWRSPRTQVQEDSKASNIKPWHWQPSIPGLEQVTWESLGLEELELPHVGEADTIERIMLQQRLESTILGKALLDAAIALKLILQHQDSFTLELADQRWVLQRKDLETQVFVPFVRRLNRELNKLLVARGIPTEAINQAILTGGVASVGAVSRWLRQKLPNAKIIQDAYLHENGTPICSRVAYGLAMLPLHPLVVDIPRQQYTDYFLFTELLRIFPDRALSFNEIIQLFENRGINTRNCQERLLAFLEGELPPGLLPNTLDFTWLTPKSQENSHYHAITTAPLFAKQDHTYRPNPQQIQCLLSYLDAIKASTQQSLQEPYTVNFALGVSV